MPEPSTVLVVGATGDLGGRAVDALLARGRRVRELGREGTDPSRLAAKGVEIARGDMLDPASLEKAMSGSSAVVTTAAGYTRRRKGDSLEKVDDLGNRNLVDAAKKTGIRRFVFTSILTCDQARDVPHFWQKKLIEDYLEASGTPFVALRPGAFLGGGSARFFLRGLRKGRMMTFGSPTVRWTYVHPDDVARYLALAVDDPRAVGRRIGPPRLRRRTRGHLHETPRSRGETERWFAARAQDRRHDRRPVPSFHARHDGHGPVLRDGKVRRRYEAAGRTLRSRTNHRRYGSTSPGGSRACASSRVRESCGGARGRAANGVRRQLVVRQGAVL